MSYKFATFTIENDNVYLDGTIINIRTKDFYYASQNTNEYILVGEIFNENHWPYYYTIPFNSSTIPLFICTASKTIISEQNILLIGKTPFKIKIPITPENLEYTKTKKCEVATAYEYV